MYCDRGYYVLLCLDFMVTLCVCRCVRGCVEGVSLGYHGFLGV